MAAGPLVGEESEAVDGVDDEEGDPQVERHARSHREEDPRLPVGLPAQFQGGWTWSDEVVKGLVNCYLRTSLLCRNVAPLSSITFGRKFLLKRAMTAY